ncbi:MAG TPA: lysine--tRNA ligase [Patescibacteria group bacterium]|nr:lysine--tRNA ligase [Patescibacteria group bacterium]
MFWADKVAQEIIASGEYRPFWVDDMKTPSGRVHVGALLGVVIHDLVYRALKDAGVEATYTYVFENHDPMDDIPTYLPREKFEQYLGMPLFAIPSPVEGYKDFAEYYAHEFKAAFNKIGSHPEILWTKDLYTSGKMNTAIKKVLDNAEEVRKIYKEMYHKEIASDWYPFQVYCESCGKVSTTRVYNWDGEFVYYRCPVDATTWTRGCGYEGKTSPYSDAKGMKGKMPWKVEWAAKWQAIGVTIEGAGKDHMSRGGSHDLASLIATRVLDYPVPYSVGYEFMLIGGKKMSSSKGRGYAAADIVTILPPELVRFLIVKMNIHQQTNFDPAEGDTIPHLFDEYQEYASHYFSEERDDKARVFELSQVSAHVKKPPSVRFSVLAQWIQMPNMENKIKEEGLEEWAEYARIWVERFASESERFTVQQRLPLQALTLTVQQKDFLAEVAKLLKDASDPEEFQKAVYEKTKELQIPSKDAFAAIYTALLGKTHGPKAGWLILSLDKDFVVKRFTSL